jgi:hypothetical protein
MDQSKIIEFRYQLWTRLCALADEATSLADAWMDIDPDLVELHSQRCSFRQYPLFDEEEPPDEMDTDL